MKFDKSPPELIETFDSVIPPAPATRKMMFGYPAGFINGNMFMGLFRDVMILRLPDESLAEIASLGGKPFEPTPGRLMRQYATLPFSMTKDRARLRRWVAQALEFSNAMPKKLSARKKSPRKR